jgi:hypothetical protein
MYPGTIRLKDLWNNFWRNFWWDVRGVTRPEHYRSLCARCGRTGQVHYAVRGCWRFKSKTGGA